MQIRVRELLGAGSLYARRWGPEGDVSSAIVVELQTTLAALGYDNGSIDGIYGVETHACLVDLGGDA